LQLFVQLKLTVTSEDIESKGLDPKNVYVSSIKLSVVINAVGFWKSEIVMFTKFGFTKVLLKAF